MYTVVGIRPVNFTASDGRPITGYTIFVTCQDEHTQGVATDKFFLSAQKYDNLPWMLCVGDEIRLLYNRYGKVQTIEQA